MDNNLVKEVILCNQERFYFSLKYNKEKLFNLLREAKNLYNIVIALPILPKYVAKIEEELIRKSIFSTAAIEGNPLTEEKVAEILAKPENKDKAERAEKEIRNLKIAYKEILSSVENLNASPSHLCIEEKEIKTIHKIITSEINYEGNIPGQYQRYSDHIIQVGDVNHGGIYKPPQILKDVESLMGEFISWINSPELFKEEPEIRSALAHYYLELIHPFADGNGRTGRAVEGLLLQVANIKYVPVMLSNYYYRNLDKYYQAFSVSENNKEHDVTPFLEFVLQGIIESLNEIIVKVTFYLRKLVLQNYYDSLRNEKTITQRQHDFIVILLDFLQSFILEEQSFILEDLFSVSPLNILYRNVSRRTARRDLQRLCELNLLLVKDGKYDLYLRVLG